MQTSQQSAAHVFYSRLLYEPYQCKYSETSKTIRNLTECFTST